MGLGTGNNKLHFQGKMSWFGGPSDKGVGPHEGLALYDAQDVKTRPFLFLKEQPVGTTGTARRLNPDAYYCAMRWHYSITSREWLKGIKVRVTNHKGESVDVDPVDWGPNIDTHRVIDLSPGVIKALGLQTNDTVTVEVPLPDHV
jgi:hypothetical protein